MRVGIRRALPPHGCPGLIRMATPRAAAHDLGWLVVVPRTRPSFAQRRVPILAPLCQIPGHVIEAPRIRRKRPHRDRRDHRKTSRHPRPLPNPGTPLFRVLDIRVIVDLIRAAAPPVDARRAGAACVFPFVFVRKAKPGARNEQIQTFNEPAAIHPRHAIDRGLDPCLYTARRVRSHHGCPLLLSDLVPRHPEAVGYHNRPAGLVGPRPDSPDGLPSATVGEPPEMRFRSADVVAGIQTISRETRPGSSSR